MKTEYLQKLYKFIRNETRATLETTISYCVHCRKRIEYGEYICSQCYDILTTSESTTCSICHRLSTQMICEYCHSYDKPFVSIDFCYEYRGFVRYSFLQYKEHGQKYLGRFFAQSIIGKYSTLDLPEIDIITSVPSHWIRRALRMCDIPYQMARELSLEQSIPYISCLQRKTNKHAPRKSGRAQRLRVAQSSFGGSGIDLTGKTILLIDDVVTTGSTCHVCTTLLRESGAARVYILSLCCVASK